MKATIPALDMARASRAIPPHMCLAALYVSVCVCVRVGVFCRVGHPCVMRPLKKKRVLFFGQGVRLLPRSMSSAPLGTPPSLPSPPPLLPSCQVATGCIRLEVALRLPHAEWWWWGGGRGSGLCVMPPRTEGCVPFPHTRSPLEDEHGTAEKYQERQGKRNEWRRRGEAPVPITEHTTFPASRLCVSVWLLKCIWM